MKARFLILIAALLLLPLPAMGDPLIPEYLPNTARSVPTTPEQREANRKAAEQARAKKQAEKEALAITPAPQSIRVWHKGKDPVASKGKTYHPTRKAATSTPIQAKLIKIYPDSIILEKKDETTIEVARKDLVKADRAFIDRIAEQNTK